MKKTTLRHVKLLETSDDGKKNEIHLEKTYYVQMIKDKVTKDFSLENGSKKPHLFDIFNVLVEKRHSGVVYQVKIFFKDEVKSFNT